MGGRGGGLRAPLGAVGGTFLTLGSGAEVDGVESRDTNVWSLSSMDSLAFFEKLAFDDKSTFSRERFIAEAFLVRKNRVRRNTMMAVMAATPRNVTKKVMTMSTSHDESKWVSKREEGRKRKERGRVHKCGKTTCTTCLSLNPFGCTVPPQYTNPIVFLVLNMINNMHINFIMAY